MSTSNGHFQRSHPIVTPNSHSLWSLPTFTPSDHFQGHSQRSLPRSTKRSLPMVTPIDHFQRSLPTVNLNSHAQWSLPTVTHNGHSQRSTSESEVPVCVSLSGFGSSASLHSPICNVCSKVRNIEQWTLTKMTL